MLRFLITGLLILNSTAHAQAAGDSAARPVMVGPGFRGLLDTPPASPITYKELSSRLRTPLNGSGNVYRIPAGAFADSLSP